MSQLNALSKLSGKGRELDKKGGAPKGNAILIT